MPRPILFRLFGQDAPTTLLEFREALRNATFGEQLGGGNFIANIRAMLNLPTPPERLQGLDRTRDSSSRDFPLIAPVATPPELRTTADPATPAATAGHEPQAAPTPGNERVFSVQSGEQLEAAPFLLSLRSLDSRTLIGIGENQRAELVRADDAALPSGNWAATFLKEAYQAAELSDVRFQFDAAGFADLQASGGMALDPRVDTLSLSGDFSAGFILSELSQQIGRVSLESGSDYVLIVEDGLVRDDGIMIIEGSRISADNILMFDGSAETGGRFAVYGGAGADIIFGGADNDFLRGGRGSDALTGGAGADTFIYRNAGESTGANYDILADFNPATDLIDLPGTVSGFDALRAGTLSDASFSQDLAAALANLGANRAAIFAPDAGDLAGTVFLVVDGNGVAGYQEGEDYVFALPGTTVANLAGLNDFFV